MSASTELARRVGFGEPIDIASGETKVVDVRGCSGLVAWFAGSCTATAVRDETGTALAGATAQTLTTEVKLDSAAQFYSIAPSGGDAVVAVIG